MLVTRAVADRNSVFIDNGTVILKTGWKLRPRSYWYRSEIDLRSVLRSVRDRMRTCSHWRLLIRQIIPNLEGLSSLFYPLASREMGCVTPPGFLFRAFLDFSREPFFFSTIRVGLCLRSVYRVMGCTRAVWRARKEATIAYWVLSRLPKCTT